MDQEQGHPTPHANNAMGIMVGYDFSESSNRALAYAMDLSQRLSARLYVVHICPTAAFGHGDKAHPDKGPAEQQLGVQREVTQSSLRDLLAGKMHAEGHVRDGEAVSGLLGIIKELGPDLVIVGSHGHGGVVQALLGSVAERLCHRSPVPVLVVPAPERLAAAQKGR